ncbi:MAG TPA: hypothetical protein VFV78_06035 [Vicinamibacterales bacterium]|nr:hypothetical protein [Vicinamibacterales bacterium]
MRLRAATLCAGLALAAGCSNTPTTPSGSGGGTSATQIFSGTVAPGESPSHVFSLPGAQALHLTFGSLTDSAGNPLNTPLTMQFGTPTADALGCNPLTSATGPVSLQAQINLSVSQGTYCVALAETSALTTTANYALKVTYGTPSGTGDPGTIEYSSTVEPGGFTSRTFQANSNGTVTIVVDAFAPATVASLNVGLGYPRNNGSGCEPSAAIIAARGSQFTVPVDAGVYCVKVSDPGTLTGTTTFTLRIFHP